MYYDSFVWPYNPFSVIMVYANEVANSLLGSNDMDTKVWAL